MAGARYIQQKTARAIQRHKGGEAIAPIGDPGEQLRIGRIVRRHNLERGQHGAGIGKRLTDGEPQRRCLAVHRRQAQCIVHFFHHDERRLFRAAWRAAATGQSEGAETTAPRSAVGFWKMSIITIPLHDPLTGLSRAGCG